MARKKSVRSSSGKAVWKGFYNVYLTAADKKAIKQLDLEKQPPDRLVQELSENGYKVSVTYQPKQDYFTVTAYAHLADHVNAGYACSCRHADLATAIAGIWFTVAEKGDWGAWDVENENGGEYNW